MKGITAVLFFGGVTGFQIAGHDQRLGQYRDGVDTGIVCLEGG
jgi:hypothetical protein